MPLLNTFVKGDQARKLRAMSQARGLKWPEWRIIKWVEERDKRKQVLDEKWWPELELEGHTTRFEQWVSSGQPIKP